MLCKLVVNFRMSWYRLFFTVLQIHEDVMIRAMPKQNTSVIFDFFDKFFPFHTAISLISYLSGTSSIAINK